jgi:hypothetical protein
MPVTERIEMRGYIKGIQWMFKTEVIAHGD